MPEDMSPRKTTDRPRDPNDPVEQLIDRVREAYRRVQHFFTFFLDRRANQPSGVSCDDHS